MPNSKVPAGLIFSLTDAYLKVIKSLKNLKQDPVALGFFYFKQGILITKGLFPKTESWIMNVKDWQKMFNQSGITGIFVQRFPKRPYDFFL